MFILVCFYATISILRTQGADYQAFVENDMHTTSRSVCLIGYKVHHDPTICGNNFFDFFAISLVATVDTHPSAGRPWWAPSENRSSLPAVDTSNPRGVPVSCCRLGGQISDRRGFKEWGDGGECATRTLTHCTKSNSGSFYFTSAFCESVLPHRSSRSIIVLQPS
ncbi:hypothetical protein EVAR_76796_1 [Eumeta japonica]|uniref:Secreted protein n=1 Tax=Eumeta variegata TaxID=151549 RepID=A0A4C1SVL9_EUMVA|nr:hypothetical protein EVAR_76796_1 [Eumeta japonica]